MNKKAEATTIILVIIVIVIAIGWGISYNSRECQSSDQCKEGQYCSSDFQCKNHPVIEKEIIKQDLTEPARIISVGLIIAGIFGGAGYALGNLFKALSKPKKKRPRAQDNFQQFY